ncbi:MAG: hypothetical protein HYZ09_02905 [Candidatus Kerfeldbacteria bacterium]|nr:hypothetical protein [Candidatus Kerfeldbacteria bacterium]
MKVYFYGPVTNRRDLEDDYDSIRKVLKRADVWLSSNTERQEVDLPAEERERAEALEQPLLETMDAIVVNGTHSDQQAGYLVAFAITTKKPTLFLYQRGTVPDLFRHLTAKAVPKWVRVVAYTDQNLERQVEAFLAGAAGVAVKEVPRIKFTLRITRSIERYLAFRTQNTKLTKADWLRQQIERLMRDDDQWRKFDGGKE